MGFGAPYIRGFMVFMSPKNNSASKTQEPYGYGDTNPQLNKEKLTFGMLNLFFGDITTYLHFLVMKLSQLSLKSEDKCQYMNIQASHVQVNNQGPIFNIKTVFHSKGIPTIRIR